MFFVDEQHEVNYEKMIEIYPNAFTNPEYQAACYIASTPFVFYKFEARLNEFSSPVDWIINWQMKHLAQFDDETDEQYKERTSIEVDYDLTSSMQHMGKLALNLWNGYEYFNLMDCLSSLDDKNYLVVKQAIDVRMGLCR